jgi:protein phosphatase
MGDLAIAGITDPGMIRPNNEDRISTTPELGLAIVADGMGGHQAGEVASGMAVDVVTRHVADVIARTAKKKKSNKSESPSIEFEALDQAITIANAAIFELAQTSPDCSGMGTTIVVTLFHDDKVCVGHVGDSRLYRYRSNKIDLLTEDHSLVQELVSRGLITPEEARNSVNKNLVTRALGIEATVEPQIRECDFQDQDIFLLCSDGLNDVLPDEETAQILKEHADNLDKAAERLVAEVNSRGGPDNVSVVLVRTNKMFCRDAEAVQKFTGELQTRQVNP